MFPKIVIQNNYSYKLKLKAKLKPKKKLTEIFGLGDSPFFKNLNYSEEQLGYKPKYKGRVLIVNGNPWLIVHATPHKVYLRYFEKCLELTYKELRIHKFAD